MAATRVSTGFASTGAKAKSSAKKTASHRPAAKKAAAKKLPEKRVTAKKASAKKAAAKKAVPAKKAGAKKAAPPKKTTTLVTKSGTKPSFVTPVLGLARPAGKKPVAKAATPQQKWEVAKQTLAQSLDIAVSTSLASLRALARTERLSREALVSDVTVVHPGSGLDVSSAEVQTVNALSMGNLAKLVGNVQKGPAPKVDIVRRLDGGMAMVANASALRAVRRSSPGLRMFSATYAYLQYVHPLAVDLSDHVLDVPAGTPSKNLSVQLTDGSNSPISGLKVQAFTSSGEVLESSVSDATGSALLRVPLTVQRIDLFAVEPKHTYWGRFIAGFDRASMPAVLEIPLRPLLPDTFQLMSHYAPFDANAGKGVKVGVIDCGVGPHKDLTVQGGNCFVTGEASTDFTDNGIGHGTHVAGIIAAQKSDSGLYGLAPACSLMAYRVCPRTGDKGRALSVDIAAALQQAISDDCDLVNISMGSLQAMPEVPAVLEKARAAGVVVIAATGNDGRELVRYPARYSHTLSVGALGRDATFPDDSPEKGADGLARAGKEFVATFSNHGMDTDFIGVGVAVLSTYPGDRYAMMSGTSMATPFTSGMAARLLSEPANAATLTMPRGPARVDAIVQLLCQHTRKPSWPDKFGGFGVVI